MPRLAQSRLGPILLACLGVFACDDAVPEATDLDSSDSDSAEAVESFMATQVTGGGGFTCAVDPTGKAYCWGENRHGELGQGYVDSSAVGVSHFQPLEIAFPAGVAIAEIRGGLEQAVCALSTAGKVYCWGNGNPTPTLVSGLSSVQQITVGAHHVCAVKTDGTAWCWGNNVEGQLGTGNLTSSQTPVKAAIGSVAEITAGYWHTCARKADGTVWCWGVNDSGECGSGSGRWRELSPVRVSGLGPSTDISAGAWHTCAVQNDGTVWCWGWNAWGQVGDGTTANKFTATKVVQTAPGIGPDDEGEFVVAGRIQSCAGRSDGTMSCWGNADYGQMGNGEWGIIPGWHKKNPVQVLGDGWSSAGMGNFHVCATKDDGSLWCWGDNHFGQTGYLNPQQAALGNTCFNYPSCTVSVPVPVQNWD